MRAFAKVDNVYKDAPRAGAASDSGASATSHAPPKATIPTVVLGFDFGARRIGVAIGNRISATARSLQVVNSGARGPDWTAIAELVRAWQPDAFVVGLPLTLDATEQKASRSAREFAHQLQVRHGLNTILVDERLSSREAATRFAARRAVGAVRRKDVQTIDAVAAEVIVEQWLRDISNAPRD